MIYLKSINLGENWELEELETSYLFPYLYRFSKKFNLLFFDTEVSLNNEQLLYLKFYLDESLGVLLNDLYEKPNEKTVAKHPTRFERFIYRDNKYVVDYTTSSLGRLMFLINLRINYISEKIENNELLIIGNK